MRHAAVLNLIPRPVIRRRAYQLRRQRAEHATMTNDDCRMRGISRGQVRNRAVDPSMELAEPLATWPMSVELDIGKPGGKLRLAGADVLEGPAFVFAEMQLGDLRLNLDRQIQHVRDCLRRLPGAQQRTCDDDIGPSERTAM